MKIQYKEILWIVTAIVLLLFLFFPIYWMIISSLRPNIEIFQFPPTLFPKQLTTEAYRILFAEPCVIRALLNTILVSAGTTLLSLSIAMVGAFGISRFSFFGKKPLQLYILTTQMLPIILLKLGFDFWVAQAFLPVDRRQECLRYRTGKKHFSMT
jgi:multiple sugar transport system permease protein